MRAKRWPVQTTEQRFWAKVVKSDGCWSWKAQHTAAGYGAFWIGKRIKYAHRMTYEYVVGPIPEGLELDHLCRNPGCCNPSHLEPVTHGENMRRAVRNKYQRKNSCKYGHDWSEPRNVYTRKNGYRWCAECARTKWFKKPRRS